MLKKSTSLFKKYRVAHLYECMMELDLYGQRKSTMSMVSNNFAQLLKKIEYYKVKHSLNKNKPNNKPISVRQLTFVIVWNVNSSGRAFEFGI